MECWSGSARRNTISQRRQSVEGQRGNGTRAESHAGRVAPSGRELFGEGGKTKRESSVEGFGRGEIPRNIREGKEGARRSRGISGSRNYIMQRLLPHLVTMQREEKKVLSSEARKESRPSGITIAGRSHAVSHDLSNIFGRHRGSDGGEEVRRGYCARTTFRCGARERMANI